MAFAEWDLRAAYWERIGDASAPRSDRQVSGGEGLVALTSHRSRLQMIRRLSQRTAPDASCAMIGTLEPIGRPVCMVAVDSGKEFAEHETGAIAWIRPQKPATRSQT